MSGSAVEIEALTSDERLALLERLWDSLSESEVPVTEQQVAELDRRLDSLDEDVEKKRPLGVPWDEVLKRIQAHR